MTNNKEFKRIVALIIAGVIAIILTISTVYKSNYTQVVLGKEYSFEDDYNLYTEYADKYVKTWKKDFVKDESITISSSINDGFIKVTVDGEISKLEARYPIVIKLNEEKSEMTISYASGTYEKLTNLVSKFDAYFIITLYFLVTVILYYFISYLIIVVISAIVKCIKEKIYKDMKQKEENNNKIIDNNN